MGYNHCTGHDRFTSCLRRKRTLQRAGAKEALEATTICQPKINDAQNALVLLRLSATNPRAKQIMQELGMARAAMETGKAQECLTHVSNAVKLEK